MILDSLSRMPVTKPCWKCAGVWMLFILAIAATHWVLS